MVGLMTLTDVAFLIPPFVDWLASLSESLLIIKHIVFVDL
jgi:hypothetical protein